jgi:hypothetical protein
LREALHEISRIIYEMECPTKTNEGDIMDERQYDPINFSVQLAPFYGGYASTQFFQQLQISRSRQRNRSISSQHIENPIGFPIRNPISIKSILRNRISRHRPIPRNGNVPVLLSVIHLLQSNLNRVQDCFEEISLQNAF